MTKKPPTKTEASTPKLVRVDVEVIARMISSAPCPSGLPQAQAHADLLKRFLAANPV